MPIKVKSPFAIPTNAGVTLFFNGRSEHVMCEEAYHVDDDPLTITLRELDASKSLLLTKQAELSAALKPAHIGYSPDTRSIFESRRRAMDEAADRYRTALEAFNAVCHQGLRPVLCQSASRVRTHPQFRTLLRSRARKGPFGLPKNPQPSNP